MSTNRPRSIIRLALFVCVSCAMLAPALSEQTAPHPVTRIYVEPFATREGSERLRDDVVAELRKMKSVSIAADPSGADAILDGGGEVWIEGYRNHNPELGHVAPNGTPIYSGFLSVELTTKEGETVWSYLATPPAASGDVAKDLSVVIAGKLGEVLAQGLSPSLGTALPQPATVLSGAGATFPFPVYQKWFTNYRRENPAVEIAYDPAGSAAGIRSLLAGSVDFAASDSPDAIRDIAPADESKYRFFPSVVGAVVPVVNLPGVSGDIAFTPQALAGIYLGKIKKWNDPLLVRANKKLHLPNLDIVVVHRADGSGTSYAWTDFLSRTDPEWKAAVGTSLTPTWPVGQQANGNDGVAKLVAERRGSIGYVEFIYALRNHLDYGRVRNRNGEFVAASLESIAAAASHAAKRAGDDFKMSIVDGPGPGVYPIGSFTWIVVPAHGANDAKRKALIAFLSWMLGPAQRQAAALGYLPIPDDLAKKEESAIAALR